MCCLVCEYFITMNRRTFIRGMAAAGAATSINFSLAFGADNMAANGRLKITSVDAYPVKLWDRSTQGKLPEFTSDFDPKRWRYTGPFAQLAGAIVVVIKTNQGITGFGFGSGGKVACEIIHGHLRNLLMGTNPLNIELLWDQMFTAGNFYGRRGVFVMALSGVDNALWDVFGKHANQPVYRLLGGTMKERIPVYHTGTPDTIQRALDLNIQHFKVVIWDGLAEGEEGKKRTVKTLEAIRKMIGPDKSMMIECVAGWDDVDYTIDMARRLEHLNLYWIEEPLSPDNILGYERLVEEIESTRIANGEHEYTRFGFAELIRHKAADVLQPDVSWCGGVTSLRKVAAMAAASDLEFTPHRGGSLFGLPLCLSSTQCQWAESFGTTDDGTDLMNAMSTTFENGYYYPVDKPGFGTELTEELVKAHAIT
jgi:L-rhamnonate dehydratase